MKKRVLAAVVCMLILLGIASSVAATPVSTASDTGIYAAMGDSIAAGAGLPLVNNPSSDDSRCFRSSQGYPNIVAQQTGLNLVNASCAGATVGDIVTQQGIDGPNVTRQIDTAFSTGQPELITITAGANDVKWVSFLRTCYATNCATDTAQKTATALIDIMQIKLAFALQSISDRSNGSPPSVVVTGYYNPISNYCNVRATHSVVAKKYSAKVKDFKKINKDVSIVKNKSKDSRASYQKLEAQRAKLDRQNKI